MAVRRRVCCLPVNCLPRLNLIPQTAGYWKKVKLKRAANMFSASLMHYLKSWTKTSDFRLHSLFVPTGMCSLAQPPILGEIRCCTLHRDGKSFASEVTYTTSSICPSGRGRTKVQEMLTTKVMEPTSSPWSSDMLLVRRKDGIQKFCVYYKKTKRPHNQGLISTAKNR